MDGRTSVIDGTPVVPKRAACRVDARHGFTIDTVAIGAVRAQHRGDTIFVLASGATQAVGAKGYEYQYVRLTCCGLAA